MSRHARAARRAIALLLPGALLLGLAAAGMAAEPRDGIPSAGGSPLDIPCVAGVPYYLQTDPAWASKTLGPSRATMGDSGCTVCCVATGVSALGRPMDPGAVRDALERAGGFTDTGLLVWDAVADATGGAVRVVAPRLSHAVIDAELSAGRPVIAHILIGETYPHWVTIVGKAGREYLVMDPLSRDWTIRRLSERAETIRGIRVLRTP